MEFPQCQNTSCTEKAQYYLPNKKLYICDKHKNSGYSKEYSVPLIQPDSVEIVLEAIKQCMKKSARLAAEEKASQSSEQGYEQFYSAVKQQSKDVSRRFNEAVKKREFYKFDLLLTEAKQIQDMILTDHVFIKYAVQDFWNASINAAREIKDQNSKANTQESNKEDNKSSPCPQRKSQRGNKVSGQKLRHFLKKNHFTLYSSALFLLGMLVMYYFLSNSCIKDSENEVSLRCKSVCKGFDEASKSEFNNTKLQPLSEKSKNDTIESQLTKQCLKKLNSLNSTYKSEEKTFLALISSKNSEISSLKEEKDQIIRDLLKAAKRSSTLDKFINSKFQTYSKWELRKLLRNTIREDFYGRRKDEMSLVLTDQRYLELLRVMEKKLPNLQKLDIYYTDVENKDIDVFFKYFFPDEVDQFYLYGPDSNSLMTTYLGEYERVLSKVTQEVSVNSLKLNSRNIEQFFVLSKHTKSLSFTNCIIELSSLADFSDLMTGSKIQTLSFNDLDKYFFKKGILLDSYFEILIKTLSKSWGFRRNLKTIWVRNSGMKKDQVREILDKNILQKVKIRGI